MSAELALNLPKVFYQSKLDKLYNPFYLQSPPHSSGIWPVSRPLAYFIFDLEVRDWVNWL